LVMGDQQRLNGFSLFLPHFLYLFYIYLFIRYLCVCVCVCVKRGQDRQGGGFSNMSYFIYVYAWVVRLYTVAVWCFPSETEFSMSVTRCCVITHTCFFFYSFFLLCFVLHFKSTEKKRGCVREDESHTAGEMWEALLL
jgi:preprotein translocase subunit SecG